MPHRDQAFLSYARYGFSKVREEYDGLKKHPLNTWLSSYELGVAILLVMIACVSNVVCLAQEERNQSRTMVTVAVKKGRLIVDRKQSRFEPSPLFKKGAKLYNELIKHLPEAEAEKRLIQEVEKSLFDDLDNCFAMAPKFYWWKLCEEERKLDEAGKLDDPQTKRLRDFNGPYADFRKEYDAWVNAKKNGQCDKSNTEPLERTLNLISRDPVSLETKTALIYSIEIDDFGTPAFDALPGTVMFRAADPVA